MGQDDIGYYRRRASTERLMAAEAGRADVSAIHGELAALYQALLDDVELRESAKTVGPVLVWAREA